MARFNFDFMVPRYDPTKRLRGGVKSVWGNTPTRFRHHVKNITLDVEKDVERISDNVGEFLKHRAEVRTPVDTGKARASWAMSTKGRGVNRNIEVFNTARTRGDLYYLNFVEHGTIHIQPPRLFFAKAQAEAKAYEKALYTQLNKRISRIFNNG